MKRLLFIVLPLITILQACGQKTGDTLISNNPEKLKVRVLYFHITNRCNTCFSIEKYTRKTIDDNFQEELNTGIVDLYIMNCELPENKELVEKYDAYGATLALTYYANGIELETEDLTNWAFRKVHTPEVFMEELKKKIDENIK